MKRFCTIDPIIYSGGDTQNWRMQNETKIILLLVW